MATRDPFAELADHIAAAVTATVPRTTSYRESVAAAVANALADASTVAPDLESAAVAFAESLDKS